MLQAASVVLKEDNAEEPIYIRDSVFRTKRLAHFSLKALTNYRKSLSSVTQVTMVWSHFEAEMRQFIPLSIMKKSDIGENLFKKRTLEDEQMVNFEDKFITDKMDFEGCSDLLKIL